MMLLIFVKACNASSHTSFHKAKNAVIPKNIDDVKDALAGILANDLKFPLVYSVERIIQ